MEAWQFRQSNPRLQRPRGWHGGSYSTHLLRTLTDGAPLKLGTHLPSKSAILAYTWWLGRQRQNTSGAKSPHHPNAPTGLIYGGDHLDSGCPKKRYDGNLCNFAPRVGFAHRLTSDGNTSLRGDTGLHCPPVRTSLICMHCDPPFVPIFSFNDASLDEARGWSPTRARLC